VALQHCTKAPAARLWGPASRPFGVLVVGLRSFHMRSYATETSLKAKGCAAIKRGLPFWLYPSTICNVVSQCSCSVHCWSVFYGSCERSGAYAGTDGWGVSTSPSPPLLFHHLPYLSSPFPLATPFIPFSSSPRSS